MLIGNIYFGRSGRGNWGASRFPSPPYAHGVRVQRASSRKLLLVLTDGEPADVDVNDPDYLAQDARQVVRELEAQGVFVWCIQLHPAHEESVRSVFGELYTLVDRIEQLPQVLVGLFLRLTG